MFMHVMYIQWRFSIVVHLPLIRARFFLKIGQERIEGMIVDIFLGKYFPFRLVDISLDSRVPDITVFFQNRFLFQNLPDEP